MRRSSITTRLLSTTLLASLAAVALPAAAQAETLTVSDIVATPSKGVTITIPTVEADDSNLTEDQIRALFSGNVADLVDELAALDAAAIRIPEIRLAFETENEEGEKEAGEFVYSGIEITGIEDGVAAASTIGRGEAVDEEAKITIETMSTGTLNVAGLLQLYGLVESDSDAMETLYADLVFGGATIEAEEGTCTIGTANVAEVRGRPLKTPITEIFAMAEQLEGLEEDEMPPPDAMRKIVDFYADLLTAFESSPMTFDGFDCTGPDDEGKTVQVRLGSLTMDGMQPGIYPAITIEDSRIEAEGDGWFELGSAIIKATDFSAPLEVLASTTEPLDEAWFTANVRKLIPSFGGIALADLSFDVPDESNPGQRIKGSLESFDITLADYINGVPSRFASNATALKVAVPPDAGDGLGQSLIAQGIEELVIGYDVLMIWDEPSETIGIENLSVDVAGLGTVQVSAVLGNATADLFGADMNAATVAAMGLTVRQIDIDLVDAGAGDIVLTQVASEQGQDVEQVRTALSGVAQGMVLAILGSNPASQELSEAIEAFFAGAPHVHLTLVAKNEAGLGLAELQGLQADPTTLAEKVDITASADEDVPAAAAEEEEETTEAEPAAAEPKMKDKS